MGPAGRIVVEADDITGVANSLDIGEYGPGKIDRHEC
jgi:hypothetical protein